MNIIGITGLAGAGKDSLADAIIDYALDKHIPAMKYSMAKPVKEITQYVFGLDDEVHTQKGKMKMLDGYNMTVRKALQLVGTEAFRNVVHPDIWVHWAARYLGGMAKEYDTDNKELLVVIPDIRFDNEAKFIFESEGHLIEVVRPNLEKIAESGHASEAGVSKQYIDQEFVNSGSLDDIKVAAESIVNNLL